MTDEKGKVAQKILNNYNKAVAQFSREEKEIIDKLGK